MGGGGCTWASSSYDTPYSVQPFSKYPSTVNTTAHIAANRMTVWPVVKAMDEWSTFQDIFSVDFIGGEGMVELGQKIRISTTFPIPLIPPQVTLEEYNEIVEEESICWTVRGFEFVGVPIPSPYHVLRTERCIQLFDDGDGGTIIHNWISYAGVGWPVVCLLTGSLTEGLFDDFNAELADEFV